MQMIAVEKFGASAVFGRVLFQREINRMLKAQRMVEAWYAYETHSGAELAAARKDLLDLAIWMNQYGQ